jgi:hypothetical protein
MVNSSNSGVCPGSTQPDGLRMCAMLTASSRLLTRPMNSSINFGLLPAASIRVGLAISVGMGCSFRAKPCFPWLALSSYRIG